MNNNLLIDLWSYPVKVVIKTLLKDMTTGKNIIFATNSYMDIDSEIVEKTHITESNLRVLGNEALQPRVKKTSAKQLERTRKKAEVFTPSWICNKMNNHCDTEWFGREGVFNIENGQEWIVTDTPVLFDKDKDWQKYIESKRLEITCGEAPYIVSRYDATTGDEIPVHDRIGILDRKLRVVNENTDNEKEWLRWTYKSFQSVYGYEFQGDNLLIARINLLITFVDYMQERWDRIPTDSELEKMANIIVWNMWQMDGITGTIPFENIGDESRKVKVTNCTSRVIDASKEKRECNIYDWRKKEKIAYRSIKEGA